MNRVPRRNGTKGVFLKTSAGKRRLPFRNPPKQRFPVPRLFGPLFGVTLPFLCEFSVQSPPK